VPLQLGLKALDLAAALQGVERARVDVGV